MLSGALLGAVMLAQQAQISPELLLLSRARIRMSEALRRIPNYVCLETIERSNRLAKRRKFDLIDVLRLEVGVVDGKEMFAWPGSGKFEDKELVDMVPAGGAIGNGSFAAHASSIFRSGTASIWYVSRDEKSLRYDYRVPQNLSGYKIRSGGKQAEAVIGYHGSFWVDPATALVTRIEVAGDDIPLTLEVLATESSIDYGKIDISGQEYWLPVGSSMKITSLDSSEFRNDIRFTGCRQFTGESVLSFDEAPVDTPPVAPSSKEEQVVVPKDKFVTVELLKPITWGVTQTGDPIEAITVNDIKHRGEILFPKKTKVTGRVAKLQSVGNGQVMELVFESLEDGTRRAPFRAAYYDRAPNEPGRLNANHNSRLRQIVGVAGRPGVVVIMTYNSKVDLVKGYRLAWTTLQ
jgi:hypothetical protein